MNYILHHAVYLAVYVLLASGLNLTVGYCGVLTMAHASFFGIGAYTYAILALSWTSELLPTMVLAVGLAVLTSAGVALLAVRMRGDFFAMASLGFQSLVYCLVHNWSASDAPIGSWRNLTNGPFGIAGIPRPTVLGYRVTSPADFALLSLTTCVLVLIGVRVILQAPWAQLLRALRDDELAARALGIGAGRSKAEAIAISAALAAIAGVLQAAYLGFVDASVASLDQSILLLCMVVVGGTGNWKGPLIGALVLLFIPELLRFVELPTSVAAELRLLLYGLSLVALMHRRPQGLAGVYRLE